MKNRPNRVWIDGVRKALNDRAGKNDCACHKVEWGEFLNRMQGKGVREDWHGA